MSTAGCAASKLAPAASNACFKDEAAKTMSSVFGAGAGTGVGAAGWGGRESGLLRSHASVRKAVRPSARPSSVRRRIMPALWGLLHRSDGPLLDRRGRLLLDRCGVGFRGCGEVRLGVRQRRFVQAFFALLCADGAAPDEQGKRHSEIRTGSHHHILLTSKETPSNVRRPQPDG